MTPHSVSPAPPVWWANAVFFVTVHVAGLGGALFVSPLQRISGQTLLFTLVSWQLATLGITVGYHRLWSHRSFHAHLYLRWALAILACLGFQGSIKWWVLRHRLHHRFTDTPHDPYNAKRGLLFSHMGWIFRKPRYEKIASIDRSDLDTDPVVRFQHKYYVPLSVFMGFLLPDLLRLILASLLRIPAPARTSRFETLIWAGFVARLLIWHFTFFINSLAHYLGEQPYDIDITARSSFLLAVFTAGEANHNYHHVFPKDYRNGPAHSDWDPSKWIIYLLHRYTSLVTKIHFTPEEEIARVRHRVLQLTATKPCKWSHRDHSPGRFRTLNFVSSSSSASESEDERQATENQKEELVPRWRSAEVWSHLRDRYNGELCGLTILLIDRYLVDVSSYRHLHPGGHKLLTRFSLKFPHDNSHHPRLPPVEQDRSFTLESLGDCSDQFYREFNVHSRPAEHKMKSLRIAKLID